MKNIYVLLAVFILLIPSGGIGWIVSPLQIGKEKSKSLLYDNAYGDSLTSFHGNTSGNNKNWYVIKFFSSSTIYVEELYVKILYKYEQSRESVHGFVLTNLTKSHYFWIHSIDVFNESDRFFHINIGPLNYTFDDLTRENGSTGGIAWFWNITLSPGTWYLICLAGETVECEIEVWINTTGKVEFLGTTEGSNTFLWPSEEFMGNLNVKFPYMAGVVNGRKMCRINNTFVGFLFPSFLGLGIVRFQYTDPAGDIKKTIYIQVGNLAGDIGNFDPWECIIGKGGIWKFRLDMLAMGKPLISCSMFAADVKLP